MYEKKRLQLRKYEVHIGYHAAYLFWNLRGVLAEKWAHGPHFNAYGNEPDTVRLTVKAGAPSSLVGLYGLRASAFVSEDRDATEMRRLAQEWLADCLTVLQPKRVTRMVVREFYSYPATKPVKVSQAVEGAFPGLSGFGDLGTEEVHRAVQYQTQRSSGGSVAVETAVFGVYGPEQAREFFGVPREGDEWGLGLNFYTAVTRESGIMAPTEELPAFIEEAHRKAHNLVTATIAPVINSV